MGKLRNARRNPPLTATDMRYAGPGACVRHDGHELTVQSVGHKGNVKTWTLVSEQGVEYSAIVEPDGFLSIGVTGRVLERA